MAQAAQLAHLTLPPCGVCCPSSRAPGAAATWWQGGTGAACIRCIACACAGSGCGAQASMLAAAMPW